MKKITLLISIALISKGLSAQVTWSGQVASIIYGNCSNCHNVNGIAPMELMSYQDAFDNANDIKDNVVDKKMPPWPPDPAYSHLAHERILTQQQIDDISDWVYNGMPRGDSLTEPAAPVFNSIAEISNPDLTIACPIYPVNTTTDLYRCFVVPSTVTADQYITALEAIPGDRSIVHHILIYSDTTNIPTALDALDPGPGYTFFGGIGSPSAKLIGAWVPGQHTYYAPNGMGIRLPTNANIVLQIHYPGGITNKTDSSKIFIRMTSTPQREISINTPLNHYQLDNGPLHIDANTIETFYAHYPQSGTLPSDISVLSVGPHMHLVGKSIKSFAVTNTQDTIPFIDIPEWDFHWQGSYAFPKVLKVPAGSILYSEATYDNTTANEENPNDPPQDVDLGESTTDEMMLIYFAYTPYQPGDENIIIDSTLLTTDIPQIPICVFTPQLYEPFPNPVTNDVSINYFLPNKSLIEITIMDMQGKIVKEENLGNLSTGFGVSKINVASLSSGTYFLNMKADGIVRTKKFLKN
jgi:hypothetical protein